MKQFYLFISFLFILTSGMAQKIAYDYDNAGNRIARKLVLLNDPNYAKKHVETPMPVEELLGERKITVYPNPTKGALAVEITGGDQKEQITLSL